MNARNVSRDIADLLFEMVLIDRLWLWCAALFVENLLPVASMTTAPWWIGVELLLASALEASSGNSMCIDGSNYGGRIV
jgi:hypothetical protein